MTDQAPELLPLEDLPLYWKGYANALRLMDAQRTQSDAVTLEAASCYDECANELKAALTRPPSERPVATADWIKYVPDIVKNAMLTAWNYICDDTKCHPLDIERRIVLADFGDDRLKAETAFKRADESFQANSIASEKVCDHPSTEKAALMPDIVELLRDRASKFRGERDQVINDMAREHNDAAQCASVVGAYRIADADMDDSAADEIERLRAAPRDGQVIANPENLHGSEPEIKEAWYVEVGQQGSGPFDRTTIETGPRGQGIVVATVNTMLPEAIASARKLIALANASEPSLLGRETVREVTRLLQKISDLAYDEDVGEPLDDAIGYANKALAAIRSPSPLKE